MDRYNIVIPSYKRGRYVAESDCCALQNIPQSYMKDVYLLIRESEREAYRPAVEKYHCNITTVPDERIADGYGMRDTRIFLLEYFLPRCEVLVTMDDDIRIGERNPDKPLGYYRNTRNIEESFPLFMEKMLSVTEDCPLASILPRLFCNESGKTTEPLINRDAIQVLSYHCGFFRKHSELNYDNATQHMSDYYFNLSVCTKGYGILVFPDFIKQDTQDGTRLDGSGGCSAAGRKSEDVSKCAMKIAELYPEYVTPYVKIRPSTWGPEPTVGLKFSWAKLRSCYKGK